MALSDMAVRQAKATGKDYTLGDLDGLSLAVTAQGGRSWHFRYCWAGKQKRMSLGTYPEVSLREAREARDKARALLAKGINPKAERKRKRQAIRLADNNSFKSVYLKWLAHRKLELKEGRNSTLAQIRRIFKRDVLPSLGKLSIYDIYRPDLLEVIEKVEQRDALTTAEKVRTWLNQLFRFALVKVEGLTTNPASDLDVVAVPKPPVAHNPFLRLPELPELLRKVRYYRGDIKTKLGILLLLLTGVRTGELRWATPDQFHLEHGLWIIPPEVVKQLQLNMRKKKKRTQDTPPYVVPLPRQAIEIVQYLLNQMRPAQRYLLAHRSDLTQRISENTLNSALTRMGYKNLLTGHGIRATISTALYEFGYPKPWVESQLSHADPDKTSAAYNHAAYVEPRRQMMQDWADRLDLLEQGYVEAASARLTIRIDGMPAMSNNESTYDVTLPSVAHSPQATVGPNIVVNRPGPVFHRLSHIPPLPGSTPALEPEVSAIQRKREEMLAIYESPSNLPVPQFAKLAGKSKDQINRELKAGKLLSISLGNRGQRVPDWQLVSVKHKLTQIIMSRHPEADAWELYRLLTEPHSALGDRSPVGAVSTTNLNIVIQAITHNQTPAHTPDVCPVTEKTGQNTHPLTNADVAALKEAYT